MEIIIGAVVFGLIVIAIIVMVIINFTYRSIKKRREDMEDDYYRREKEKEQKEKHPFGKDYFKSAAPKKPQEKPKQQGKPRQQQQPRQQEQAHQQTAGPKYQKETARKTVTTDGKVTIFDDRKKSDKRKIFDDHEGEYVEFEEV